MTGMKLELLGIGIILAGIAMSIPNFGAYLGGAIGLAIVAGRFFGRTSAHKRGGSASFSNRQTIKNEQLPHTGNCSIDFGFSIWRLTIRFPQQLQSHK